MNNQIYGSLRPSPTKRFCSRENYEDPAKRNKSSEDASASLPAPPVLETSASSNHGDLHLAPLIEQKQLGLDTMCTPPGTPRSTPDGTPPASIVHIQNGSNKSITIEGNMIVKTPYKDDEELKTKKVTIQQLKGVPFDVFCELRWMSIYQSLLNTNPVTITIDNTNYPLRMVNTILRDDFKFEQPLIKEADGITPQLKLNISQALFKALCPILWQEGYYTVPDIKPANFHIDASNIIHLFDVYYPGHEQNDDGVIDVLARSLREVKLPEDDIKTLITRLNQLPKNSTGRTMELNNMAWDSFKTTYEAAIQRYYDEIYSKLAPTKQRIPTDKTQLLNIRTSSILWYLESQENTKFR